MSRIQQYLQQYLLKLWNLWSEFWFAPIDLFNVSVYRFHYGLLLFFMYATRLIDLKLYYGDNGLLTHSLAADLYRETFQPWFLFFPASDQWLFALHWVFVVALLLFALGVVGRKLTWAIFALHLVFYQRNYAIVYGADTVTCFFLFYLSFCQHNRYFNVISFVKGGFKFVKESAPQMSDPVTTMGVRLLQVQVAVIYAYTGMEKLKGSLWWEGSAIWHVLGNTQLSGLDFTFLSHAPWLVAILSFLTLFWEVYFPFAVAMPKLRGLWLLLGTGMHLSIALFMGLWFFSTLMINNYLLFVSAKYLRRFYRRVV